MRQRIGPIVIGIVVALLLAVVVSVVIRSRPAPSPQMPATPDGPVTTADGEDEESEADEGPDIQVSGTDLTIKEDGEVIWRAHFGGEIELDEDQQLARATDVRWQFEGQGFTGMTLEAPLMRTNWSRGRLYFSKGIVIEGENGEMQFGANAAEYQFDTHKIIGRGNVRFRRGSFHGEAEEIVVDNDRRIVTLKRGSLTQTR